MTLSPLVRLFAVALVVFPLGGCGEQETSVADAVQAPVADDVVVPSPGADTPPVPAEEVGIQPVVVAPETIAVGSALTDDGEVQSAKPVYAVADTVYVSMPTAGHDPGETIQVYWSNAKGMTDKQESKVVVAGEPHANFAFSAADGMAPGIYTVQVDIGDVPVGIVDFRVE